MQIHTHFRPLLSSKSTQNLCEVTEALPTSHYLMYSYMCISLSVCLHVYIHTIHAPCSGNCSAAGRTSASSGDHPPAATAASGVCVCVLCESVCCSVEWRLNIASWKRQIEIHSHSLLPIRKAALQESCVCTCLVVRVGTTSFKLSLDLWSFCIKTASSKQTTNH